MDESVRHESVFHPMKLRRVRTSDSGTGRVETSTGLIETLFHEHWPAVYRHVLRLVGDPAEAEDLALETFVRLYQHHPAAVEGFNVGGWLHRVATNLGLQSIRSFKRREHYELTAGKDALDEASENRPAEILAEQEEQQLAREALAHMNERQAQLLVLRYSGMSYREIARALNLSSTSIGPLLLRAERQFEKRFRALNQEEP